MTDRWITVLWITALIAVSALMLLSNNSESGDSRPLTSDTRAAGLAGFERWLDLSEVRVATLRKRYSTLDRQLSYTKKNLLIVHVPMLLAPEGDEIADLHAWVAKGNTLVVSASLMESPAWHLHGGTVVEATERLADIRLKIINTAVDADEDSAASLRKLLDTPSWIAVSGSVETVGLSAVDQHPLGRAFGVVQVPWDGTRLGCCTAPVGADDTQQRQPETNVTPARKSTDGQRPNDNAGPWRTALKHHNSEQAVAWQRRWGDGTMVVLGHPSLLANAAIYQHGNRQFAINLVAEYLGNNATVVFDHTHQGDSDLMTPAALLSDIRVLYTLGFLLLLWAIYLLADAGTWERVAHRRPHARRGAAELIAATGGYLARRLQPQAVVEGLLDPLRDRLARKWNLPQAVAIEQGLEKEPIAAADHAAQLQAVVTGGRKRINYVRLQNLILKLRRQVR